MLLNSIHTSRQKNLAVSSDRQTEDTDKYYSYSRQRQATNNPYFRLGKNVKPCKFSVDYSMKYFSYTPDRCRPTLCCFRQ